MKIRIITDSASDIHQNEYPGLTVLPLTVTFGAQEYQDGINLSHREFYEKLIEGDILPKTSQVTPFAFEEAIEEARAAGETVIIVTLTGKLSGTYHSAIMAASAYPEGVYVIDSETVCVGERILIEHGLKLVEQGLTAEQIVAELEAAKKNIRVIALLDTLEYLRKGGRISNTAGFVGGMLSIKPVVAIEDGEVVILGKARGSRNGNNLLNEQIKKYGGVDFSMPFALAYSGLEDFMLQKYIVDNAELWRGKTEELPISVVGGTIGTYAGPGAIAAAFFHL